MSNLNGIFFIGLYKFYRYIELLKFNNKTQKVNLNVHCLVCAYKKPTHALYYKNEIFCF